MTTDVLWSAWDGRGIEHLRLDVEPDLIRADSLIVSVDEGRPFRARYTLECDGAWRLRRARLDVLQDPARVLELHVDGGRWSDARAGTPLPFGGCVDVDIYPSPFTNTLPIRRLADSAVGQPVRVTVAWVHLPALTLHAAPQEYTLLERAESGARWRFRALDSNFTAELHVDAQGVVRDYPEIARRLL
jgi:uncharacterized protein